MCHQPGFRLIKPKAGFERIAEWAKEQGFEVKELQPSVSRKRKLLGKSKKWRILKKGELGIHMKTDLCNLKEWPGEWKRSLEKFVRKLQQNSKEVHYFHDFEESHLAALAELNRIPWKPLPERGIVKFMVENRGHEPEQ